MSRRDVDLPGWDSFAEIVDEVFVERTPRRPEVRRGLERECRVLPVIAPLLPLAVPTPIEMPPDPFGPWRVRHEMIPGRPADPKALTGTDGTRVGAFLRSLHDLPLDDLGLDLPTDTELPATLSLMAQKVLPLLDHSLVGPGAGCSSDAVLRSYNPSAEEISRARDWYRLGPWHEVLWGLGEGGGEYVTSGLEGVVERLGVRRTQSGARQGPPDE